MKSRRLIFVGLGLNDEKGITLKGLEAAKKADTVFIELYTSLMPELSIEKLEKLIGKKIKIVSRRDLEEESGAEIISAAMNGTTVLLVPGDPLIATTHIDLRIRAEKKGIKTNVIHAPSIISAAIGISGLQVYKFGKTVTIPFPEYGVISETPYNIIMENRQRNLHTLCLLDVKAEKEKYMTIKEALEILMKIEEEKNKGIITGDTLAVGIARVGSENTEVKAGAVNKLLKYNFGSPPHTLIFPASLHFMEVKALITLAKAPKWIEKWLKD